MDFVCATGATVEFDGFAGILGIYLYRSKVHSEGSSLVTTLKQKFAHGFVRTSVTHMSFESVKRGETLQHFVILHLDTC